MLYRNVCILYGSVYILYIQHICTLQVSMSTSSIVLHYVGWSCQSPNPQEIHCFNWEFCVNLHIVFQDCNPAINHDLPVLFSTTMLSEHFAFLWIVRVPFLIYVQCTDYVSMLYVENQERGERKSKPYKYKWKLREEYLGLIKLISEW